VTKLVKRYPVDRPGRDHSGRRWHVHYNLAYDGGGSDFTSYYRTLWGAKIAVWWNRHVFSWGGTAEIFDARPLSDADQEKTQ
jgi:hypothetical protein